MRGEGGGGYIRGGEKEGKSIIGTYDGSKEGNQCVTCDVESTPVGNGQTQRATSTSTSTSTRASKARTRIRDSAGTIIAPIVMVLLQ